MSQKAVVIGAGITGTLVGHRLAGAGYAVTILEARHVGAGSSSRTAAGFRQQFSTPETVLGMRYAVDVYRRFPEEVGGSTVPIVQNGYLFLLPPDDAAWAAAAARVAMQHDVGLGEAALLDIEDTVRQFPWVSPEAVGGATWCPTDGFLRPEVIYNEAAAAAVARGARLVQGAPVEAARGGERLDAVYAKGAWHEADLFVDATNAWSPRLARVLGAAPLPIDPVKRYLWFLERGDAPMSGDALMRMPLVIAPTGAYCRPENAGALMMGFAHDARPEPDFTYDDQDLVEPAFFHRSGADSRAYEAWMALADAIPAIGEFAGISATTCGYYGASPDHNPFLGYDPQRPNLLRLAGFSGHGAMFGPFTAAVALALADAGRDLDAIEILGRPASLLPFRLDRGFAHAEAMVI